jgi:hypothetical protein
MLLSLNFMFCVCVLAYWQIFYATELAVFCLTLQHQPGGTDSDQPTFMLPCRHKVLSLCTSVAPLADVCWWIFWTNGGTWLSRIQQEDMGGHHCRSQLDKQFSFLKINFRWRPYFIIEWELTMQQSTNKSITIIKIFDSASFISQTRQKFWTVWTCKREMS